MAETTIEWTATDGHPGSGNSRQFDPVREPMTALAKRCAVRQVEPQFWVTRPRPDVMRMEVAAAIVAAMDARKSVPRINVEPPTADLISISLLAPFLRSAIDIAVTLRAAMSAGAYNIADFLSGLGRMAFPRAIASPFLSRRAHFCAAFGGHLLAAHVMNKSRPPPIPSGSHLCTSFGGVDHG